MSNSVITKSRNVCDASLTKSTFPAGTKNPCPKCGHPTTTKRDGVLRSHTKRKKQQA